MSTLIIGKSAPTFNLPATSNKNIALKDFKGKNIVLYFYPKDSTPGCTTESENFRDAYEEFSALNTVILGISKDSITSHEKFKQKKSLPFDLLSDVDGKICELYGVIHDKNLYGRIFRGIERSTFLIDKQGILRKEWRKVKVTGHVAEVLAAVKELEA